MSTVAAGEEQLWTDYRDGAMEARAQLLEKYLPLARRLAAALYARRAVDDIEFGDYLHLAYAGLLEAMQRYRHGAEAQFTTFATYRIRGSVLNGIPRMTEVGDQLAWRRRVQRERTRSLLGEADAVPAGFAAMLELVAGIALTYQLEELNEAEESALHCAGPYGSRLYEETQRRMRAILEQLPERERRIVHYHYFHQIPFDEIALLLDLSKSRISRLHKRALDQVREALCAARLSELY